MVRNLIFTLLFLSSSPFLYSDVMGTLESYIRGDLVNIIDGQRRPIKCGTFYNFLVTQHWDQLNPELQYLYLNKIKQSTDRDSSMLTPSKRFMLHWDEDSTISEHAVPSADINGNGVPDYIDSAAVIFDHVWDVEINQLGYDIPPQENGDTVSVYHVYFSNLSYMYGQTFFDSEIITGSRIRYSSHIEMENDYREGFYSEGLEGLKVTAAHEFHHAIQLGYNVQYQQLYFFEMTSTFMEDVVYPDINDYYQYLAYFFYYANNKSFNSFDSEYPYGNCLYLHMLTKQYSMDILYNIWENFKTNNSFINILHSILNQHGSSWRESLNTYGTWIYFTGERADTENYFDEADLYPQLTINNDAVITIQNTLPDTVVFRDTVSVETVAGITNYFLIVYDSKYYYLQLMIPENTNEENSGYRLLYPDNIQDINPIDTPIQSENDTLILVITNAGANTIDFDLFISNEYDTIIPPPVVADIYPYPNPLSRKYDREITFANVPLDATIYIYSVSGKRVVSLEPDYNTVSRKWDLKDQKGNGIPSGVYFYLIRGRSVDKLGKFAIIK